MNPGSQQTQPAGPQPGVTFLYTATGSPVQVVNINTEYGTYPGYKTRAAKILGVLQILLGTLIVITQIVLTALRADGYQGFVGFWAPIIFILAGTFGVQSSKSKSKCTVITTMVLSITGACICSGVVSQGSVGAAIARVCRYGYDEYGNRDHYGRRCGYLDAESRSKLAFHLIMVILGILEAIVAIVAAAFCCKGCCCQSRPGVVMAQSAPPVGGVQISAVQYHANPAGLYPVSMGAPTSPQGLHPSLYPAPVPSTAFQENPGAPAYEEKSAPPPMYQEKV